MNKNKEKFKLKNLKEINLQKMEKMILKSI